MYSETCPQNDLYFFPPLDRNDDDNYFVFNKYIQNPCISTIEENPIINEPQKNPRFDTNIEDDNSYKNEEDECKININNTDINLQKIVDSNILKQIKENPIINNKPSETDKFEKFDSTNQNTKKKYIQKKKEKEKEKEKTNKKRLRKKVKKILIRVMILYVNDFIKKVYGGKIGQGVISQKVIKKIDSSESQNITIAHNRKLVKKTLKEILSQNISQKYTSAPTNINEIINNNLLNEENEDKRKIFIDLFNKTFLDWVLMLSDPKDELKELYEEELWKKYDVDEIDKINQMIKNFEVEFLNGKSAI